MKKQNIRTQQANQNLQPSTQYLYLQNILSKHTGNSNELPNTEELLRIIKELAFRTRLFYPQTITQQKQFDEGINHAYRDKLQDFLKLHSEYQIHAKEKLQSNILRRIIKYLTQ